MPVIMQFGNSYAKESFDGHMSFSENPADSLVFTDGAAATAYLAARSCSFSAQVRQVTVNGQKNKHLKTIS